MCQSQEDHGQFPKIRLIQRRRILAWDFLTSVHRPSPPQDGKDRFIQRALNPPIFSVTTRLDSRALKLTAPSTESLRRPLFRVGHARPQETSCSRPRSRRSLRTKRYSLIATTSSKTSSR